MERKSSSLAEQVYKKHRIATFGRNKLAEINLHYTGELFLGHKANELDEKTTELFELGRRAFGHLPSRTRVYMIRKVDVYKIGPGEDDISVTVFMEGDKKKS